MAAEAWEDVRTKRLKNIRAAAEIAIARRPNNVVHPAALDSLVENCLKVEKLELGVTKVDLCCDLASVTPSINTWQLPRTDLSSHDMPRLGGVLYRSA